MTAICAAASRSRATLHAQRIGKVFASATQLLGKRCRILAQVEVSYSNSMIEALWRSMKHGWLFLHHLDTFAALEKLIAFYVEQHNSVIPHSAFAGQTPDEMYFGRGDQVPVDLAVGRACA